MSAGPQAGAVVVATTALRVPLPGKPPGEVVALVETDAGRRLVTLAVDPDRRPKPGETVEVGFED
ncbi:MAG: hypothetical protein JST08_02715 [Actinobacteria bacterium]|nr:hypothetical protein [Actinomycetota bacterium]